MAEKRSWQRPRIHPFALASYFSELRPLYSYIRHKALLTKEKSHKELFPNNLSIFIFLILPPYLPWNFLIHLPVAPLRRDKLYD